MSASEVRKEDAAVEWGKMPASEEEKIPTVEMDKNSTREGGGIGINLEGKEQHEMDTEDPASKDGSAVLNKVVKTPIALDEGTDLPSEAVPEEDDASRNTQMKKIENKRKRVKLQEIKKEEQLSVAEKTEVPVEPHMPDGAEDAHLVAVPEEGDASRNTQMKKKESRRKMIKLQKIKKEEQLSVAEKTEVLVEPHMPDGAEDAHLVAVPEEGDASRNTQMKKKESRRKRSKLQEIKKEGQLSGAEKTHVPLDAKEPWRWHATFSTVLKRKKLKELHKGFILLRGNVKRIVLLDTDGTKLDAKYLNEGETVYPGAAFEFSCHMADVGEPILEDEPIFAPIEQGKKRDLKRKRLKRRPQPVTSPQVALWRSSIGRFAQAALVKKKGVSPQVKRRNSESSSITSPNLQRRRRPRKLKSHIWRDCIPIYEYGKLAKGRCKHCHEVFPASQSSGTNHIRRHIKTCLVRSNMQEMVAKMRASSSSPKVLALDDWNYSQEESRRELANMIAQHGLPFSIVEYSGFIKFVKSLNPLFKMVSRTTVRDDCMESYKERRSILREMLKNSGSRVSLTADMWTSNQRLGYLCVTCHFIDKTWKLQKRILRFHMMETPHNGFRMYNAMLKSLQYWNIEDRICSITLDNASVNGKMMEYLKENLMKKQMLACGGNLFHIRCAVHVLNLIVQDGLFVMEGSIDKIRASVNYVRSSQTREQLFADIVKQLGIKSDKEPSIDVATRWNSTYLMIESSLPYMEAFDQLVQQDHQFKYAPSAEDWKMAKEICSLLKVFFEATKVVSGSSYPTANRYFHEIWRVKMLLEKHGKSKNKVIASMVSKMQKKFDKYWNESYLANCIPVILDPRYKLEFVEFRIELAFKGNAKDHLKKVDMVIKSLFEEYSNEMGSPLGSEEELQVDEDAEVDDPLADWEAHLAVKKKKSTSELDRYLSDELFPRKKDVDFDILEWWEMHSIQYPVLSCIARDVLAIQASTVASESSFSAGGRIISDHRTRLKSNTVEGLLCLQDWLNADDPKPASKDVEEEEYLVFHQASKCPKKRRARSRSSMPSSSPLSSPASSCSMSPSTSPP